MPGQRSIILVSPGFYNPDQLQEQMDIADRALHSGVTVSALDARGLYTTMPDASTSRAPSHSIAGPMLHYMHDEASAERRRAFRTRVCHRRHVCPEHQRLARAACGDWQRRRNTLTCLAFLPRI